MSSRSCALADAKVQAMLDALAQDIDERPEVLRPIDAGLVEYVRSLVAGVDVDC
ncbi:MAG: type II toxin-antitoxin system PrlF family antitoxin [Nitrosospira sp.]|nr:type II toxin-antitoxin system PrlF family antitoxin [Nitrosospira sp.]